MKRNPQCLGELTNNIKRIIMVIIKALVTGPHNKNTY